MDGYSKRLSCGSCGSDSFETILDLGDVPLAGYFPTKEQLKEDTELFKNIKSKIDGKT